MPALLFVCYAIKVLGLVITKHNIQCFPLQQNDTNQHFPRYYSVAGYPSMLSVCQTWSSSPEC